MNKLLLLLICALGLSISCKKKTVLCTNKIENFLNDTIQPSEYLMTYPGSWWEYDQGTKDSCTHWEKVSYTEIISENNCNTVNINHYFLPNSTRFGLVEGNKVNGTAYSPAYSPPSQILIEGSMNGEIIDSVETISQQPNGMGSSWKNIYIFDHKISDTIIQGQNFNDIIVIRHKQMHGFYGQNYNLIYDIYNYYAKNVGYIKTALVNSNGEPIHSMELIDYYIAPH